MNLIYKQRIDAAIDYIESNLADHLSLDLIAKHCHFSPFHFHRIFSGAMNETLNSFIARKRLEKATNLLVFKRELSITDVAFECGFSSSANFSKAIKQYFGYTPKDIREPKNEDISKLGRIFEKYGKTFEPSKLYPDLTNESYNLQSLKVKVKTIQPKRLAKLKSEGGYKAEALFNTWDRLTQWVQKQSSDFVTEYRLAWCYDNPAVTPLDKCKYEASIEVDNKTSIVEPFYESFLPQGEYAVLHVKGGPEDISQAQKYLFNSWLPNSCYEPDDVPLLERYLNDVRTDGYIETEILIKLKQLE